MATLLLMHISTDSFLLLFTQYKTTLLTAINSHFIAALPAKMVSFNSNMGQNTYCTAVTWSVSSKICCHVIVTQERL